MMVSADAQNGVVVLVVRATFYKVTVMVLQSYGYGVTE
jgi:hypothetical protein